MVTISHYPWSPRALRCALSVLLGAALPTARPSAALAQPAGERGADTVPVLRRRAQWGAVITPAGADSGPVVRRVDARSRAAEAGLRAGDRISDFNGIDVRDRYAFLPAFHAVRGGDTVRLRVVRARGAGGTDTLAIRFVVDSVPHERIPGTVVRYGALRSELGHLLRTVVTRPAGADGGRLPAVLFVPWLSCDEVEKPDVGTDGFVHMLHDVAAGSGMVLMRVEKPGVGDSEGPECSRGSLANELAGYRAALRQLRALPGVDSTRLFVMGGSLGGGLAPILAAEDPRGVVGVISVGGFTKTWYEHMLEIERRRLDLLGRTPREVNAAMRGFALFYTEYLIGRRAPAEVLAAHPDLKPLWYDEPAHQYGRPASYYHEVQQLDVEGAWSALAERGIPALIVWGEYDWIMSRGDQERAASIVNARRPGGAKLVVLPKTDHGLNTYRSLAAAFADERPTYDGAAARVINRWLRAQLREPATTR